MARFNTQSITTNNFKWYWDDETIPGKDSVWYQAIKQVKETYPK